MACIANGSFYCGTSNVVLPVPNKAHLPPEYQDKTRLHYFGTLFNSVEINGSFYKIPMNNTTAKWSDDVPADFRFTFKLWKGITHGRELNYEPADVDRFLQAINGVGDKKGCLLVQLPASIKVSYFQKIRKLLGDITGSGLADGWKLAVEFRDKSWYRDTVYEMLEEYSVAVVVHDMPASATPMIDMEAGHVYLRFHGEKGDYRGGYTDEYLEEQAENIKDWQAEGKQVYSYFNNTMGDAVHNAATLQRYGSVRKLK